MNGDSAAVSDLQKSASDFLWQKMKSADFSKAQDMLLKAENDYVGACGRFFSGQASNEPVWLLRKKNGETAALILNSRSTVMPVLRGLHEIPAPNFLKGFLRRKKIHSVQGLKNEVLILEETIRKTGRKPRDIIDYDLMSLDRKPDESALLCGPENLFLCTPRLIDLDKIAPLQAGYEQEEVLPKGSVFSPAASRANTAHIITNGKILAAQIDGRFVGKINVNAISFTRYQVGGVYVHPAFRGLGIARRMAAEFITSLMNEGKGVTLFVKKNNTAAVRLYTGLGFQARGDYRITYY